MIQKRSLILLSISLALSAVCADKNEKFIVNARFKPDAMVYVNRGTDLLQKGDFRGARVNFEAAIRIDPTIWPAYLDHAQILAHDGKWELALQDCNAAMRLRPGFFRTAILRAEVNQHLGRDRESLTDLNLVISLHADDETDALAFAERAWLRTVSTDATLHNPALALADAHQACRLNYWKKATFIETLAAASAASGNFDEAIRFQEKAMESGKLSGTEIKDAEDRLSRYKQHEPLRRGKSG